MTNATEQRRTFRMEAHRSWGDTIFWWKAPDAQGRGRMHGHMRERPRPGDRIVTAMQSGRNAIFEVEPEGNQYPHDPPDQYFVSVAFVAYEDETPEFQKVRVS
jgi:hypothetical protein